MAPNPPGRPCLLTPEEHERVLTFVEKGLVLGQIARLARIPKRTLVNWLTRGEKESEDEPSSKFVQFWLDFEEIRAKAISTLMNDIRERLPNWQASWEMLRSAAREDFGLDAGNMQELVDIITKLKEDVEKIKAKRHDLSW